MAMVTVVGMSGNIRVVPGSVYNNYLKHKGYSLLKDVQDAEKAEHEDVRDEGDVFTDGAQSGMDAGNEEEDIESMPIGEMSGRQVKRYAEIKGIDVSAARSTKEAKDIVRKWLQENGE